VSVERCRLEDGKVRCGDRSLSLQQLYAAGTASRQAPCVAQGVRIAPFHAFLAHGFASPCIGSPAKSASCIACKPSTPARSSTPCRRGVKSRRNRPGDRDYAFRADGDRRVRPPMVELTQLLWCRRRDPRTGCRKTECLSPKASRGAGRVDHHPLEKRSPDPLGDSALDLTRACMGLMIVPARRLARYAGCGFRR